MQNIFNSGYSLYQVIWFFFIYAFAGWCGEVVFKSIRTGKFVNRGFLNGPICPIYGFGAVAVILILHPIQNNLPLLFVGSVIVTSILELVTGYILKVLFHTQWWDYSDKKFNIGGYICLQFSLLWGIACVALIKIIQPLISDFVNLIPNILGIILLIIFGVLILSDLVATVVAVSKMNKQLEQITILAKEIRKGSNALAENLGDKAIKISNKIEEKTQERKEQTVEKKKDTVLDQAREKIQTKYSYVIKRLVSAFPNMQNTKNNEALNNLKNYFEELKNKKKENKNTEKSKHTKN